MEKNTISMNIDNNSTIKESALPVVKVVLDENAFLPHRAHDLDVGADLFTPEDITIDPLATVSIDTGVHIEVPKGYCLKVEEKSGLALRHGIQVLGGIIDPGYTGTITAILHNNFSIPCKFQAGDKICQIVFYKIETPSFIVVDKLDKTERSDGGFGSTGK